MSADWSPSGVDWRDESKDEVMARDWLETCRRPDFYETDVYDRVLELTGSDLDPARGWRLVRRLIELAAIDQELWQIGANPLSTIVREHEAVVGADLAELFKSDPKYRRALQGQISTALHGFRMRQGLNLEPGPHARPTSRS